MVAFSYWYICKAQREVNLGNSSLAIVNVVSQILLAEAEYSFANKSTISCVQAEMKDDVPALQELVARDFFGMVIARNEEKVRWDSSILVEAIACREGIKLAIEKRFEKVVFETDSENLFHYITKSKEVEH
ncbi:hypothetical protein PTKIN_Ptkin08bG0110800 [Pterospermum kingtungense]